MLGTVGRMHRSLRFRGGTAVVVVVIVASMVGITQAGATAGGELWVADTTSPGPLDRVTGSAVSPDGSRVFVTGSASFSSGDKFATVAYDASGAELWIRQYRRGGPYNDSAAAIGVSPDGAVVFVTGWSSSDTDLDYLTFAYDAATGATVWRHRYSSPLSISQDTPAALGVSPDGSTVFVTGTSDGRPNGEDYLTVAYVAATGHLLWTVRYNLAFQDDARTLAVSPDGKAVFVSGYSVSTTALDIETIAYDAATGDRLWKSRYNGPSSHEDQANAMAVSPDGATVYVAGFSEASNQARDFVTLAYKTSTGALRWVRRYDGPAGQNDNGKAIVVSPDGSRIFVTGYRTGHRDRDAETIAYSSTGRRLWLRAYNGPSGNADEATAIGISPDGKDVFVTGFRIGDAFARDFVTLGYKASSGEHLWEAFHAHYVLSDSKLVVNPDGSAVYVSGISADDFITIAYATS
jgi:PQQ-like domain